MQRSSEFAAVLRRCDESTRSRAVLLLSYLDGRNSETGRLSEDSIFSILKYACPLNAPRFLFGLSTNGKVVRTADKGETWTELTPSYNQLPSSPNSSNQENNDEENPSMMSFFPRDLSCSYSHIDSFENIVVLGGLRGFLSVSLDNGLHFTGKSFSIANWSDQPDIRGVCVLTKELVALTNGKVVSTVKISPQNFQNTVVEFGAVSSVFSSSNLDGVCWMSCVSRTLRSREFMISEPNILHLSWDYGEHFVSFRHNLGSIRCLDNLKAVRNAELPQFPFDTRVVRELMDIKKEEKENGIFEYSKGSKQAHISCDVEEMARTHQLTLHSVDETGRKTFYRFYAVVGGGTPVMSYDYSAILCLGITFNKTVSVTPSRSENDKTNCTFGLFTVADKVHYIPYARSSWKEMLLCCVTRCTPEEKVKHRNAEKPRPKIFIARGNNSVGTMFSTNFDTWSAPQTTGPVGIIASDGGELLVCTQRNVVVRVAPSQENTVQCEVKERTRNPIPKEMRVPALIRMSSC